MESNNLKWQSHVNNGVQALDFTLLGTIFSSLYVSFLFLVLDLALSLGRWNQIFGFSLNVVVLKRLAFEAQWEIDCIISSLQMLDDMFSVPRVY